MDTSNFDLLKRYFRVGGVPPEFTFLHRMIFNAKHEFFRGTIPKSWREIYGPRMGADLQLPSFEQPLAIEDEVSCVVMWNATSDARRGVGAEMCYVQVQRVKLDGLLIIPFGESAEVQRVRDMIADWERSIKIDWGMLIDLHHDPSFGPLGNVAGVVAVGNYVVDPDTGQMAYVKRNAELLNDMCSQLPGWRPFPEGQRPYFDEDYCRQIKNAIVHAVNQFALLK